ncbi:hypothetical protein GOV07_03280 [Candidatus Woesearchaeota archaeon]|nr:hypothetical protein [Candidatus Woesearchaeota archaeon]
MIEFDPESLASLSDILDALEPENHVTFLMSLYKPGKVEVADALMERLQGMSLSNLLQVEIEHAKDTDPERLQHLAREYIDREVESGSCLGLEEMVAKCDANIAAYAIERLEDMKDILGYSWTAKYTAGKIALAFGNTEQARQLWNELEWENSSSGYIKGHMQHELGNYKEAIQLYLKEKCGVRLALPIAQEHVPRIVKKVAKLGYKKHHPENSQNRNTRCGDQDVFAECAIALGKEAEARKLLVEEAQTVYTTDSPRFYLSLVAGLMNLGEEEEAQVLARKIDPCNDSPFRHLDKGREYKEFIDLYELAGIKKEVSKPLLAIVQEKRKEKDYGQIITIINVGYEITGDVALIEEGMRVYEQQEKYSEAARVAENLGKEKQATLYQAMDQMIKAK